MRSVQVYINDEILDLFNDEKISVTSSVQNINDISKVFTDFSQTFTVPASKRNNKVFKHYYQNDVDNGFIAKERQPARIEINYTPFRSGKIQLEGAELVNGEAQSYRLTFYGEVVTLKDLFGDNKLKDLTYNLQFERTGANVIDTITNTNDLDIRFPLITSDVLWQYGTSGVGDISNSSQAIDYTKLFPAVKVAKVFEAIEDTYGLSFNGNFLTDKRFTNLFTWWKHKDDANFPTESTLLEFDLSTSVGVNDSLYPNVSTVNEIKFNYVNPFTFTPQPSGYIAGINGGTHNVKVIVNTASVDDYWVDTYRNGVLINSNQSNGSTIFTSADLGASSNNVFGLNDTYQFELRATASFVFDFQIEYEFILFYSNLNPTSATYTFTDSQTNVIVNPFINFNLTAPDITVVDYFSGVLKMFNLTCYPLSDKFNFQIEPLDQWYSYGDEVDITEYVDVKSIKIDRPKLYKNIDFSYKKSKSFINEVFNDNNNREYGSLKQFFGYDGGDFKIDLPFDTLQFQKFTGTNLQVGYSLTREPDYKPYIPNATMLYLYENQTTDVDFWIDNGTSAQNITSYVPFGSEVRHNSQDYSINFNQEISSLTLQGVTNSLYLTYYLPYLANLFSDKTRIVTLKTMLPLRLLNYISLDDALIVRDKKYRINDMKSDLTTGEVEFVLISDFVNNPIQQQPILSGKQAQVITLPFKSINSDLGGGVTLSGTSGFIEPLERFPLTIDGEQNLSFTIAENTTYASKSATFDLLYTLPNGDTKSANLYFIQEGIQAEDIAADFKVRVLADGGAFEAEQCLIDTLNTLL